MLQVSDNIPMATIPLHLLTGKSANKRLMWTWCAMSATDVVLLNHGHTETSATKLKRVQFPTIQHLELPRPGWLRAFTDIISRCFVLWGCFQHSLWRAKPFCFLFFCFFRKSGTISSGVHRLFEGQGRKEGHFSTHFGSQEGTLAHFGSQEGTLVCVLAPKRAVYHVLTSHGGSLICYANLEGTLACFFSSQEAVFNNWATRAPPTPCEHYWSGYIQSQWWKAIRRKFARPWQSPQQTAVWVGNLFSLYSTALHRLPFIFLDHLKWKINSVS